jgi:hypothetical protein
MHNGYHSAGFDLKNKSLNSGVDGLRLQNRLGDQL